MSNKKITITRRNFFFEKENLHRKEFFKEDVKNIVFNECDLRGAFFYSE